MSNVHLVIVDLSEWNKDYNTIQYNEFIVKKLDMLLLVFICILFLVIMKKRKNFLFF